MAIVITEDGVEESEQSIEELAADDRAAKLALLKSVKLRGQEQMRSLRFNVAPNDRKKVLTALKMAQKIEGAENYGEAIVVIANDYIKAKKIEIKLSENSTSISEKEIDDDN